MATTDNIVTAEEFAVTNFNQPCELVRGQVATTEIPGARHGQICSRVVELLHLWQFPRKTGHVLCNNSGMIVRRNPDTVRGPDVSFTSYERLPRGRLAAGYQEIAPDVVFEVILPSDRWIDLIERTGDYLSFGVLAVCLLDPDDESALVYHQTRSPQFCADKQIIELPGPLEGFRKTVAEFFED